MGRVLPILFNTDMVRAILDGRKTVTRRAVKVPEYYPHFYKIHDNTDGAITCSKDALCAGFYKDSQVFYIDGKKHMDAVYYKAPCKPGDILYVRETWQVFQTYPGAYGFDVLYRADQEIRPCIFTAERYEKFMKYENSKNYSRWISSQFMPKEAARIFLRVTDVRVERLHDITEEQAKAEGVTYEPAGEAGYERWTPSFYDPDSGGQPWYAGAYAGIWNSTVRKPYIDRYGWEANPYVWVIEFERCEKPE